MEKKSTIRSSSADRQVGRLLFCPPTLRNTFVFTVFCLLLVAQESPAQTAVSATEGKELLKKAYECLLSGQHDSSIILFSAASDQFLKAGAWPSYLYCLNGLAENLIRTANYARARQTLARADSLGRSVLGGSDPVFVRTLQLRGYLELAQGHSHEALPAFEEALRTVRQIAPGDSLGAAGCLQMLGSAHMRLGEYAEAERSYSLARELVQGPDPARAGLRKTIMQAVAQNFMAQGNYPAARKALQELQAVCPEQPDADPGFMIGLLNDLSDVDYALGEFGSSVQLCEDALERSRRFYGDRHPLTVNQIARLGDLQARAGRYDEAVVYLSQAVNLYGEIEGTGMWALGSLHQRLADALREQGNLDSALAHGKMGLALTEASNGKAHPGNAPLHESLARTERSCGDAVGALDHGRSALALYRAAATPGSGDVVRSATLLADLNNWLGNSGEALALADSVLELVDSSSTGLVAAEAWRVKAEALLELDRAAEAQSGFRRALAALGIEEPYGAAPERRWLDLYTGREAVQSLSGFARAGRQLFERNPSALRELKSAYEASRQATEILADMRARYLSEQPKLDLASYGRPAYGLALQLALEMRKVTGDRSYVDEAFALSEASKAGALIDAVVRADGARFGRIPAELIEREHVLKRELFACENNLRSLDGGGASALRPDSALFLRRFELQRQLDRLLASYATRYPEFSSLARRALPVSVSSASALLDRRTALVEFCLVDETLVTFVLSSDGLTSTQSPLPAGFQGSIRSYCESLRTFDVGSCAHEARQLGRVLIDPVRDALRGKERLLIVPCDDLWYLPFETLLTADVDPTASTDFTTLPYLLNNFEVTYLYSATFLRELEARPGREEDTWAFGGFAPSFGQAGSGPLAEVLAQAGDDETLTNPAIEADSRRQGLGELPEAGVEVRSIAAAFEHQHHAGTAYLGEEATEASFKQRASEYAYLHVASHSFIDERHPGLTGILFGNQDTSGEDGVLHAGEMFDLKLQASLVVLSSCESGLGKMVPGEGLLAMTRGLFWSGAQNVVVSLWDVYDTHARDLMVRFYPHLLRGESIASSIREAKLAMIADRRTAFPGKWGGFVHLGVD